MRSAAELYRSIATMWADTVRYKAKLIVVYIIQIMRVGGYPSGAGCPGQSILGFSEPCAPPELSPICVDNKPPSGGFFFGWHDVRCSAEKSGSDAGALRENRGRGRLPCGRKAINAIVARLEPVKNRYGALPHAPNSGARRPPAPKSKPIVHNGDRVR